MDTEAAARIAEIEKRLNALEVQFQERPSLSSEELAEKIKEVLIRQFSQSADARTRAKL